MIFKWFSLLNSVKNPLLFNTTVDSIHFVQSVKKKVHLFVPFRLQYKFWFSYFYAKWVSSSLIIIPIILTFYSLASAAVNIDVHVIWAF